MHGLVYVIDGTSDSIDDDVQALEEFIVENIEAKMAYCHSRNKTDKWLSSENALQNCQSAIDNRTLLTTLSKGDRRVFLCLLLKQ